MLLSLHSRGRLCHIVLLSFRKVIRVLKEKICTVSLLPLGRGSERCSETGLLTLRPGLRRLPTFRQWHVPGLMYSRLQLRGSSGFTPLSRASCCSPVFKGARVIDEARGGGQEQLKSPSTNERRPPASRERTERGPSLKLARYWFGPLVRRAVHRTRFRFQLQLVHRSPCTV